MPFDPRKNYRSMREYYLSIDAKYASWTTLAKFVLMVLGSLTSIWMGVGKYFEGTTPVVQEQVSRGAHVMRQAIQTHSNYSLGRTASTVGWLLVAGGIIYLWQQHVRQRKRHKES